MTAGPARRLPDADRQPRGRHAARARRAARRPTSWPARTRAARACCSTATASRRRCVSYHEHNERARARRARGADARRRRSSRSCPTRACRWSATRASCSCRRCVAAGLAVEVLPGPSAALTALVASALPADAWRFVGFLPRKRAASCERVFGGRGDARGVRVAAAVAASLARAGRGRSGAARGGLPRADQAARGGRARHGGRAGRAATRASAPRGEIVLVVGGAPAAAGRARRRRWTRCGGWSTRAPSRGRRRPSSRS